MSRAVAALLPVVLLAACATASPPAADASATAPTEDFAAAALERAVADSRRDPANVARDRYRHPAETLAFFGIRPDHTVVEITPGAGWYSEILAPYLRERGTYVAAVIDPASQPEERARDYYARARQQLETKFGADAARFDRARIVAFDPTRPVLGEPGSADAVLTFRNVHNWRMAGTAEAMFKGFYDVLKPGGVLGVVEHRAAGDLPADDRSGYVGEAQVIALAEAAGFELDAKSEVNANPNDTKDHPNGVWTLPPSNRHEDADKAKYQAIGESDRMTLRFRKP